MKIKSLELTDIISGILSGLVIVIISTAVSALIFKESLSSFFSIGVSCILTGALIINLMIASFSTFKFAIARIEPAIGAVFAIIFKNIAEMSLPEDALLATLFATIFLTSIAIGVMMYLVGYFRLGQLARYLPYPVLGGVIASTAWIMGHASLPLLLNTTYNTMPQFFTGLGFAVFLLVFPKISSKPWILPFSLLITSFIVNIVLKFLHVPHLEAMQHGWFFPTFKPTFLPAMLNFSMVSKIQWSIIYSQLGYIVSLMGIIIIVLLLNVSSIETIYKTKADLEHELKLGGISNVLGSLVMSFPCNLSVTGTILNKDAGAKNRSAGIIASLVCLLILIGCPNAISYLAKPIIGGLLLFIATKLLMEWLYQGWKKLPFIDYLIVIAILIIAALWGFLPGVFSGIVITCIVFIVRSAFAETIKFSASGESYRSNVIRPFDQQKLLANQGKKIHIYKLQGYLFFGSVKLLLDKVTQLVNSDHEKILRFIIFDFQHVNGIDSSTSFSFIRLLQLTQNSNLQLLFAHCSSSSLSQLQKQGVFDEKSKPFLFSDLDQALEWCENQFLEIDFHYLQSDKSIISDILSQFFTKEDDKKIFKSYLEKIELPDNHILVKQNDVVDCLYLIESGEVTTLLEDENRTIRLSKSSAGTIIGEIGFYLHKKRTATVRTETPCIIYKLSEKMLNQLEDEHPNIALLFQKGIINVLAMRVIQTNYELKILSH